MNEWQVRTADPENIDIISSLAERIWKIHYPPIIGMDQVNYMLGNMYSRQTMEKEMKNGIAYRIAFLSGNPVGFSATELVGADEVILHKLYLDTTSQGKGWGARLLKDAESVHKEVHTIKLQVNRKNFTAINFYFNQGYTIAKVYDKPIGHGFVMEDFIMQKTLKS